MPPEAGPDCCRTSRYIGNLLCVCLLSRTRIIDKIRTRTLDTHAEFSQLASAIVCRFTRTIHDQRNRNSRAVRDARYARITTDSRRGNPPYVANDREWLMRARATMQPFGAARNSKRVRQGGPTEWRVH